ncbi:MAG TPA: ACP S-malonyltransferase [Solirubrobacterales bacterium]|nr:ACP S-malonyltransferase [Solirubrobacterales bacterium]
MDANSASAILFPGQGVGDSSNRELVARLRPDLIDLATELVGEDPFERMTDGTAYAQPAVYCASIAGYEQLGRPAASYFAGHSLGEVGALAAAGAIDDADGLRIVVARGRVMDAVARAGEPGGMLAVGSDREDAAALANEHGLTLANENSPQQFVLSGPLAAIESAEAAAKESGLRAKKLAVAGAFHTEAMASGVEPFRQALDEVEIGEPDAPVVSSTSADFFAADPRDALAASLVSPIRWTAVLGKLGQLGVTRYLDVGPGKVLAGLVRRTLVDPDVEIVSNRESALA